MEGSLWNCYSERFWNYQLKIVMQPWKFSEVAFHLSWALKRRSSGNWLSTASHLFESCTGFAFLQPDVPSSDIFHKKKEKLTQIELFFFLLFTCCLFQYVLIMSRKKSHFCHWSECCAVWEIKFCFIYLWWLAVPPLLPLPFTIWIIWVAGRCYFFIFHPKVSWVPSQNWVKL